jgi:NTP pyrophosphatase (non-canonical NTP hydrolase)
MTTPSALRKSKMSKFEDIATGLDFMAQEAFDTSENHGFHDDLNDMRRVIEKYEPRLLKSFDIQIGLARLMLMVSELGEAAEGLRHGDEANYGEELADTMIRIGDEAMRRDVPLGTVTIEKMAKNIGRPRMHGKLA